jgi:hypothetical protein
MWTVESALPMGELKAREELRPQEEIVWRREVRQDQHCGQSVGITARHRGPSFSIMVERNCAGIMGRRNCSRAGIACQCKDGWMCDYCSA